MKSKFRVIVIAISIAAAAILAPTLAGATSPASGSSAAKSAATAHGSAAKASGKAKARHRGASTKYHRAKAKHRRAKAKHRRARAERRKARAKRRAEARRSSGTYNRWKWFKNTYWIVPKRGIYSIFHADAGKFVVARGQTVFHITDYFNGYWTGVVTVKVTRGLIPTCQYVLGQITPQGKVHMTMYKTDTGEVINYPRGNMVRKRGKWTMVNEMTANSQGSGTISHWAYMVQSKRGDRTFRNLPFARESIPQFMSACPEGPPILHKPKRG